MIQISTDEVYGPKIEGESVESDVLKPSSPYSASKASADLLINSFIETFDLSAIIIRPTNNFGIRQHPEKFLPKVIRNLKLGNRIPVYGNGMQIREWTPAKITAKTLVEMTFEEKFDNHIFNLGTGYRIANIHAVELISEYLGIKPKISFVEDRLGHDVRYAVDSSKLRTHLDLPFGLEIEKEFINYVSEEVEQIQ